MVLRIVKILKVIVLLTITLQAQMFKVSLGPEFSNPKGDFNSFYEMGYGVSAQIEYQVIPRISLTLNTSYGYWHGDEDLLYQYLKNNSYSVHSLSTSLGIKTHITEYFYTAGEIGYHYLFSNTELLPGNKWLKELLLKEKTLSRFGQGIALGFEKPLNNNLFLDGSVKYLFVPGEAYTYNRVTTRIALSYQF